jgi:hypothetical protein
MFGAFSLGDSVWVYRLQRKGTSLDLEGDLMEPHTPLWEAWLALLTQQAMGRPTYVLYDLHAGEAFVQVRYLPHQAAAAVAYVAPSLSEDPRAARAWRALLDGVGVDVVERGIQRVFASLPESGAELEVFHQAGFAPYAGEDIFRLADPHLGAAGPASLAVRPLRFDDWGAVQKLCVAVTPQRVRQAEGGIALASDRGRQHQRYVLPGDGDDVMAALTLCLGGPAHWLRMMVHPDARDVADDLIRFVLASLPAQGKPVYCSVRQYEGGMRAPLEAAGFEPVASSVLMVKHTAAWVRLPALEVVPALKGSAEPVPPAYHTTGELQLQTHLSPPAYNTPPRR